MPIREILSRHALKNTNSPWFDSWCFFQGNCNIFPGNLQCCPKKECKYLFMTSGSSLNTKSEEALIWRNWSSGKKIKVMRTSLFGFAEPSQLGTMQQPLFETFNRVCVLVEIGTLLLPINLVFCFFYVLLIQTRNQLTTGNSFLHAVAKNNHIINASKKHRQEGKTISMPLPFCL